ncbi:MAG: CBS domain-containing protein [Bacteroidetes bacterium]|nr:CBS domain-containing protein [Bacteroidota bacterium]
MKNITIENLYIKGFPSVHPGDKAAFALQLMEEYEIRDIPVSDEQTCLGLVRKNDLLDLDSQSLIKTIEDEFVPISISPEAHFTAALKLFHEFDLSVIPVKDPSSILLGVIKIENLLKSIYEFLGVEIPGAIIVIQIEKNQFSLGELSRLIEMNNAFITQMNTSIDTELNKLIVTIKLNRKDISVIMATLQRYDYHVLYYFGGEYYENDLKENFDSLMAYLNI